MNELEIITELRKLSYRVVPEFDRNTHRFEIIIEPWDYEQNRRASRKQIKRTGLYFGQNDVSMHSLKDTDYAVKLREVQLKLINHLKQESS